MSSALACERTCGACHREIDKRQNESWPEYRKRKFCSPECYHNSLRGFDDKLRTAT